jgi:hypothetical protein
MKVKLIQENLFAQKVQIRRFPTDFDYKKVVILLIVKKVELPYNNSRLDKYVLL